MAKSPPSFELYYNDWIGGTYHLSHKARDCYLSLLIYQWQNSSIPDEKMLLMNVCRITDQGDWDLIWREISDKFEPLDDSRRGNARMDRDRIINTERWRRNVEANESRRRKATGNNNAASKTDDRTDNRQTTARSKTVDWKGEGGKGKREGENGTVDKQRSLKAERTATGFDEFWNAVHFKRGKQAAKKAYIVACRQVAVDRDISAIEAGEFITGQMRRFAATPESRPRDITPIHPTTWLNQGRYDDEDTVQPAITKPELSVEDRFRQWRDAYVKKARAAGAGEDVIDETIKRAAARAGVSVEL